jgi:hypothetical protein
VEAPPIFYVSSRREALNSPAWVMHQYDNLRGLVDLAAKLLAADDEDYRVCNKMIIQTANTLRPVAGRPRGQAGAKPRQIVRYARAHGVAAAAQHFKVKESTVRHYRRKYPVKADKNSSN